MGEELLTSFFLGIVSTLNPCVLPLFPGFLVYLSGSQNLNEKKISRFFLGVFILAGVLTSMLIIGFVIAFLSISIGKVLVWIIPIADILIISLGVLMLININPFKQIPMVRTFTSKNSLLNSYFYGFLYGPLTFPCSGPLIVGIFAYSVTVDEVLNKLFVFLAFGLGMGLPLLILSLLSGTFQRQIVRYFAHHSRLINIVGGVLLIGVGVFHIIYNWEMIKLFL